MILPEVRMVALPAIPLIHQGDDLVTIILNSLATASLTLQDNDILVVTSKIVSKSEGRLCDLQSITPSPQAHELATITGKDPRFIEVALQESQEVVRVGLNVLVTRHRLGFVSANAGIDHSNVGTNGESWVLLLPVNPDQSAATLHMRLWEASGAKVGIVISDTHGRPHRLGNIGIAIGVAGMPSLVDMRGQSDLFGRTLQATIIGFADEIAAAADLLSGQAAEGLPVTLIRGMRFINDQGKASDFIRPLHMDLFR